MRILAFDTAGRGCSVGLWQDGALVASTQQPMAHGQAEQLMPMIDLVRRQANIDWSAIDRLAVTIGPGSFTGLRVGLAAAHGLALASGVAAVGLSSLEVHATQAARAHPTAELIVAAVDARRDDIYLQPFLRNLAPSTGSPQLCPLAPPLAAAVGEIAGLLAKWSQAVPLTATTNRALVCIAGDAAPLLGAFAAEVILVDQPMVDLATLAALAAQQQPSTDDALRPLYIRPPDAALPRDGGQLRPAAD